MEAGLSFSDIIHAIKGNRMNYKPSMRKILAEYGDRQIEEVKVCRRPLTKALNKIVYLMSGKNVHDRFFHLFLVLKVAGKYLILEKTQELNMSEYKQSKVDECIILPINKTLTINDLLNNAINKVGAKNIFVYNVATNNCQRFVMDIIESSNISITNDEIKFILQDVKNLLPYWSKKLAFAITSLANRGKILIEGYGELSNEQLKHILSINYK